MEIINIDIIDKNDFFEKYDKTVVSNELLNYLINSTISKKQLDLKIIINSKLDIDFKTILMETIKKELEKSYDEKKRNNLFQVLLIFLGIFFICLSVLFQNFIIWHELLLIGGWVPIWEAIDIELFRDLKARTRRDILKKILNSSIEIKKETN